MRLPLVVTAPGKLFLIGEYAVLDGLPAAVAAVRPGVRVSFDRVPDSPFLHLEAPELNEQLTVSPTALPEPAGPLSFLLAALREFTAAHPLPTGLRIRVAAEADAAGGRKLGLGFSAAICAATVAGLFLLTQGTTSPDDLRPTIFASALRAHRAAQGGTGSGADVAAAVYGGILWFEAHSNADPRVRPLEPRHWPELVVAWTNKSAATPDWIARYRDAASRFPVAHAELLAALHAATRDFASRLCSGQDLAAPLAAAVAAFDRFADGTGFSPLTPQIVRALQLARDCGVAAKWSGAGGGDCVIGLADSATRAAELRRVWQAHGLQTVNANWSKVGTNCV